MVDWEGRQPYPTPHPSRSLRCVTFDFSPFFPCFCFPALWIHPSSRGSSPRKSSPSQMVTPSQCCARVIVDEKDLSEEQVREGYAWHYKKYSTDETLAELETTAREAKVGLWSEANPLEPWEFRDRRSAKEETPKAVASKTGKSRQQSESPEPRSNFSRSPPVNNAPAERYWLNTASGTRHNIRCQYYNNTKKGRFCGPTEGKACGTCGG